MQKGYRRRREKLRDPRRILVIVCEGKETEKIYFRNYRDRKSGLKIKFPNSTKSDPFHLVKSALREIPDLDIEKGDQIWCVFDSDNRTEQVVQKTIEKTGDKVKICFSNPSFELWYLLHFISVHNKTRILNEDLIRRIEEQFKKIDKNFTKYSKTENYFNYLENRTQNAIDNAKKLNQMHAKKGVELFSTKSNPSTQVFKLVEYILKISVNRKNQRKIL